MNKYDLFYPPIPQHSPASTAFVQSPAASISLIQSHLLQVHPPPSFLSLRCIVFNIIFQPPLASTCRLLASCSLLQLQPAPSCHHCITTPAITTLQWSQPTFSTFHLPLSAFVIVKLAIINYKKHSYRMSNLSPQKVSVFRR